MSEAEKAFFEKITLENVKRAFARKGYTWFEEGTYNLNIFGVRCKSTSADKFDDYICVAFRDSRGVVVLKRWKATTDPGLHYLKNPVNHKGTAILVPDQYRGAFTVGKHANLYAALIQTGPVKVWRDNNGDATLDMRGQTETGVFGINIHRSDPYGHASAVGKHSAGCQVFMRVADFQEFMTLVHKGSKWGKTYTYTLITEADLS
eukprot:jgi/Mesvir1/24869/Mv22102-RA.1